LFGAEAGTAIETARSSRGCAFADFDGDGDLNTAIWNRNAPLTLLRNDSPAGKRWIAIRAPIDVRAAGFTTLW
jgi:hypothetical protein